MIEDKPKPARVRVEVDPRCDAHVTFFLNGREVGTAMRMGIMTRPQDWNPIARAVLWPEGQA